MCTHTRAYKLLRVKLSKYVRIMAEHHILKAINDAFESFNPNILYQAYI